MNENNILIESPEEDYRKESTPFFQVDLLKAFMIAFVIIDHSFAYTDHGGIGFELWERMSIPVFLIVMGFNMGNSFAKKGDASLKELYSWNYFKKKLWRFLFPYFIFYIVSTTAGFILYEENFTDLFNENWFLEYIIYQKTILEGPGNWFIPIIFQSILLLPILYKIFTKSPLATLILCFIIEICMHLFLFSYIGPITPQLFQQELYVGRYIILLYLSAIGMGFWFSRDHNLFSKKNLFVWLLFPISLGYMIAWDFFAFRWAIDGSGIVRGDYNYLTFIYSAFVFLVVLKLIPKNPKNKLAKVFTSIGRSTFHIYLIQDLFFIILYVENNSLWTNPGFLGIVNILGSEAHDFFTVTGLLILNWVIIMSVGVLWWYIEKKFRLFIQNRKN